MRKYATLLKLHVQLVFCLVTLKFYKFEKVRARIRFVRAGVTEHFAELEDATVHYWLGGNREAPPLLLIPPLNHDGMTHYYRNIIGLSKEHRIVLPDLVWFGDSTSDKEDYTIDFQARVLLQLMDHLELEHAPAVGVCYGGTVAYRVAELEPNRINKLVIAGDPVVAFTSADREEVCQRVGVKDSTELLFPETPEDLRHLIKLAWYDPPPLPMSALRQAHKKMFRTYRTQKRALLDDAKDYKDRNAHKPSGPDDYLPQEILLLWGKQDAIYPNHVAERTARALGDKTEFKWIDRSSHSSNLEQPKEFNRLILEFLRHEKVIS